MPKATKLASGNWRVRVYDHTDADGKKHYLSFTAATKKEAEYMAAEHYIRRKAKSNVDLTVKQAMTGYIDGLKNTVSPATIYTYDQIMRLRLKSIMDIPIKKITLEQIQIAIDAEASRLAPKTVRNISAFLSSSIKKYYPDFVYRVKLPQKSKSPIKIPTQDEVQKILAEAEGTEMEIPLLLAACLGLRRSEILGLKWSNIDFDKSVLQIDTAIVGGIGGKMFEKSPKTFSGYRQISIPPFIVDKLRFEKTLAKTEYVTDLNGNIIYKRYEHILEKLGLPHYRLHDLRHYHASIMLAMGIPNKYAQQRMGHATDNMLKNVYQHIIESKKTEIDNTLDSYFDDFFKVI